MLYEGVWELMGLYKKINLISFRVYNVYGDFKFNFKDFT